MLWFILSKLVYNFDIYYNLIIFIDLQPKNINRLKLNKRAKVKDIVVFNIAFLKILKDSLYCL